MTTRNDSADASPSSPSTADQRNMNGTADENAAGNAGLAGDIPVETIKLDDADPQPKLAECRDRLLRLQAEMENLRRRTSREIADERRYGPLPLARDLLSVLDNVDRAVEAGDKAPDAAALLEGFRLVGRQLRTILEQHQIKPIAAEGEPFNPNLHEAILQQPSDQPSGTVVMQTQQGYQLHDRVVRPSQVIVSAGAAEEAGR